MTDEPRTASGTALLNELTTKLSRLLTSAVETPVGFNDLAALSDSLNRMVRVAILAIEAEAAAQAREALEEHIPQPGFLDGTGYVWCGCGWDTIDHDYDMSWPEHVAASAPQRPDAP